MAAKCISRKVLCNLSYARKLAILKNAKTISTQNEGNKSDLLDKVSFLTNDCTIEELEVVQDMVVGNLEVHEDFISEEEENRLLNEVEPYLTRQTYQYDHWDGAIHGYRETEKTRWTTDSLRIFKRIKDTSFTAKTKLLPSVHVLDLAKNGYIKPHIDSIKFCGPIIAGLSLLSPSVMRFIHEEHNSVLVDALLPRFSLYIMRGPIRFSFTHEILEGRKSTWKGQDVTRDRRISVILRSQP
ncbi:alpha-ketoglutarate-dependent dioxygenase alkB homolog 7, mitochondrial [Exaiptasia diaphana]|uniref:Alpha-ketoglutarate-dependent dioxygenase AlkB-like domain-containing protein n=1 Tax=Exaiptasia diaphana TaxID=2652724 RepID=A0A913XP40_EXADI|nr:alpha-ketoglutarate-dependent dioxygenase alkB homolog 7, mitochondrial [Exaiptasia diaphana]KXJ10411.1 Alpha-ketoglutarate-dependent dioxygenase alkB-like 7, mitochondrial [Exaiptasia diaphana]